VVVKVSGVPKLPDNEDNESADCAAVLKVNVAFELVPAS
jgi:hypothetical protein